MKRRDVVKRIEEIKAYTWDAERAHSMEEELWKEVLETIASGKNCNPRLLATEALKTKSIEFPRWCA